MIKQIGHIVQIGDIVFVETPGLEEAGVNPSTIRAGVSRNLVSWIAIKHPSKPRIQMFEFAKLRPKYQKLVINELCGGLSPSTYIARTNEESLREIMEKTYKHLRAEMLSKFSHHSSDRQKLLARAAGVFVIAVKFKKGDYGFRRKGDFYAEFVRILSEKKWKYLKVSNTRSLHNKLKIEKEHGIVIAMEPNMDNKNARKYTETHQIYAEKLYSLPLKLTDYIIHEYLCNICKREELPIPSLHWVTKYLQKPEIKNLYRELRSGESEFKRRQMPFIKRILAISPGDMAMIDGTKIQLYCRDEKDKETTMNIVAMIDVYSRKITSFHISETETHDAIFKTMAMHFDQHAFIPDEIVTDNASGFKKEEMKHLITSIERKGCKFTFAPVGEPNYKNRIERFFGVLQSRFLRTQPNYIGEGVRSKNKSAHPNPDWKSNILGTVAARRKWLPTKEELIRQVAQLIQEYNSKPLGHELPSPDQLFTEEKIYAIPLKKHEIHFLTWKQKEVTMRRSMIELNLGSGSKRIKLNYQLANSGTQEIVNTSTGEVINEKTHALLSIRYNDAEKIIVKYNDNYPELIHLFTRSGDYISDAFLREKINFNRHLQKKEDKNELKKQTTYAEEIYKATKRVRNNRTGDDITVDDLNYKLNSKQELNKNENVMEYHEGKKDIPEKTTKKRSRKSLYKKKVS